MSKDAIYQRPGAGTAQKQASGCGIIAKEYKKLSSSALRDFRPRSELPSLVGHSPNKKPPNAGGSVKAASGPLAKRGAR